MPPVLRNILATVAGLLTGAFVNGSLVALGGKMVPPPPGGEVSSMEALAATMPLFGPEHFLFPFLAHAIGSLTGACLATLLGVAGNRKPAWLVGAAFLMGGAYMVYLLPAPLWFEAADLTIAYLPMAWLGARLAERMGLSSVKSPE